MNIGNRFKTALGIGDQDQQTDRDNLDAEIAACAELLVAMRSKAEALVSEPGLVLYRRELEALPAEINSMLNLLEEVDHNWEMSEWKMQSVNSFIEQNAARIAAMEDPESHREMVHEGTGDIVLLKDGYYEDSAWGPGAHSVHRNATPDRELSDRLSSQKIPSFRIPTMDEVQDSNFTLGMYSDAVTKAEDLQSEFDSREAAIEEAITNLKVWSRYGMDEPGYSREQIQAIIEERTATNPNQNLSEALAEVEEELAAEVSAQRSSRIHDTMDIVLSNLSAMDDLIEEKERLFQTSEDTDQASVDNNEQ